MSADELSEWRAAIRALPPADRSQLLRDAAGGRAAASEAIMLAAASAASPILLGLSVGDPLYEVTVGEHRARLAETELAQIAEIDQVIADAEQAAGWLEAYACQIVPEHELRDAQAAAAGGKPLASLTTAEKAARVAAGVERGDADLRDSLYTPATPTEGALTAAARAPTAADAARFAALPLAERIAAGERGAGSGLSPSEIVAHAVTAAVTDSAAAEE